MSTATKVAIATTAGAVAATAAGLATTEKGRELRQKVSRKLQDLVDKGSITLKKTPMRHVVEEIESVLGGMLLKMGNQGERHGRVESLPGATTGARTGRASQRGGRSRSGRR